MEKKSEDLKSYEYIESYRLLIWSFTSIILFTSFEDALELGIYHAIIFVAVFTVLASGAEILITHYANYQNNIDKMSNNQIRLSWINGISIIFALIMIFIFSKIGITHYLYPLAIFLLFLSVFSEGTYIKNSYLEQAGIFGLIASVGMFGAFLYFGVDVFNHYENYISAIISGGGLFLGSYAFSPANLHKNHS